MSTTPSYPTDVVLIKKRLADSDSTNVVDVYDNAAGTKAVRITGLGVATDNSADRVLKLWVYDGSVAHVLGAVSVPTLAGTNGTTARVSILAASNIAPFDADGVQCVYIPAGCKLQASVDAALAAGKYMWILGRAQSFV